MALRMLRPMRPRLGGVVLAAVACWCVPGSAAAWQAPDVPEAAGTRALRVRLAERLRQNRAVEWTPAFVEALRELLEQRRARRPNQRHHYVPVRDGSIAPNTMAVFDCLNPEWKVDGIPADAAHRAPLEDVVATIADFDRQLREAGLELLVVPVPDRLMVYPDLIATLEIGADFTGFAPGFTRFELALLDAGVDVVDVLEPLARARRPELDVRDADLLFLREDSHWSPLGAAIAGDVVAARLRELGAFADLPDATGARIQRIEVDRLRSSADGLEDTLGDFVLERVVDADGEAVAESDEDSPLVVIGDSYTRIFGQDAANFACRLHYRLGFAPDVIASPGGGALSSRRMLCRRADPVAGKRAVVWMFTVRALIDGPKQWRRIPLVRD